MRVSIRATLVLSLLVAAVAAHADLTYSNIDATITFEDNSVSNLNVLQSGNSLTFTAGSDLMYVDNVSGPHTFATINISYDATSNSDPINELNLLFTGATGGNGAVDYNEQVFDMSQVLLSSVSGTKSGDAAFIQSDDLTFEGQTAYHVEKTFILRLGPLPLGVPTTSFASIGLIEQNAVPEPASMGALAIGALGLLARRRRK